MEEKILPPEYGVESDGSSDVALLKAISENAECAHILAEIARGGDARQLVRAFIDEDEDAADGEGGSVEVLSAEAAGERGRGLYRGVEPEGGGLDHVLFVPYTAESADFWNGI